MALAMSKIGKIGSIFWKKRFDRLDRRERDDSANRGDRRERRERDDSANRGDRLDR